MQHCLSPHSGESSTFQLILSRSTEIPYSETAGWPLLGNKKVDFLHNVFHQYKFVCLISSENFMFLQLFLKHHSSLLLLQLSLQPTSQSATCMFLSAARLCYQPLIFVEA